LTPPCSYLCSPDSQFIAWENGDRHFRVYNGKSGALQHVVPGHFESLLSAELVLDRYVCTTGNDRCACLKGVRGLDFSYMQFLHSNLAHPAIRLDSAVWAAPVITFFL
jgi:hypothetical protein